MKLYIPILLYFILCSFFCFAQKDSSKYNLGKNHFRTLCSSCHSFDQEIYGPMLASISKKKEEEWLISFIKNSQDVINSGDPYAKSLFEKFNNQVMPSFEQLSKQDIQSILYYLEIKSVQTSKYYNDLNVSTTTNSNIIKGKQEFSDHCSACHFIHKESNFAPALGSVTKRHSREWLVSFIRNSQKKIKEGDLYANHLFNEFDRHVMTRMDFLSSEEINSILDYIEYASVIDASYKGKINKIEYKKQATAQIKEFSSNYSVISVIYIGIICIVLFAMIFLLYILTSFTTNIFKK